mmetsp:Transcript_1185/g.3907  ORF Transcript_1185/g.3907 Transcript_1185/m.3907 type:complete len:309 (+) Transcript_1185:471-1397(+)
MGPALRGAWARLTEHAHVRRPARLKPAAPTPATPHLLPLPSRRGVVYVVDAVDEVRRRLTSTGELPLTLLVVCDSGAVSTAIACAALVTAGIYDEPTEAATRIERACGGRGVTCRRAELLAVSELANSLSSGAKRRAKKAGKDDAKGAAMAAKGTTGPGTTADPISDAVPVLAAAAASDSEASSSEDDGGPLGELAREREREQRRLNYDRAVRQFGAPGSTPLHIVGAPRLGDGWTTVAPKPAAKPKAPIGVWASNAPKQGGAYSADGLTDKQRKNRRKAEKAKELSRQREEDQKTRLAAAGLSRGAR